MHPAKGANIHERDAEVEAIVRAFIVIEARELPQAVALPTGRPMLEQRIGGGLPVMNTSF